MNEHGPHEQLCCYSRSELLAAAVLEECPLGLNTAEANHCSCSRRVMAEAGGVTVRVLACLYPRDYRGRQVMAPDRLADSIRQRHLASLRNQPKEQTVSAPATSAPGNLPANGRPDSPGPGPNLPARIEQPSAPLMPAAAAPPAPPLAPVALIQSLDDLIKVAKIMSFAAGCRDEESQARYATRIIAGLDLGLSPSQAVSGIMVVNGAPTIFGDTALALVRRSGLLEDFQESHDGVGESRRAVCAVKRRGSPRGIVRTFSVAEARRAGLLGKQTWKQYEDRMLTFRARSWALRDEFGDVLKGLAVFEEAQDIGPAPTPTVAAPALPTAPPPASSAPPAAPTLPADPAAPADPPAAAEPADLAELLGRLNRARLAIVAAKGWERAGAEAAQWWKAKLAPLGVASGKDLTREQAERLLAELLEDPAIPF